MFPRLLPTLIGATLVSLAVVPVASAIDRSQDDLKDLFFGAAMYEAYQDNYFDAIVDLDTEIQQYRRLDQPELDPFTAHYGQAAFSVGDLELSYRMHQEAGRAIEAVLEGNVPQPVRNEAAYRLARIHYHKQQPQNALHALQMIEGRVPERVRARERFLRARVYMELGRFTEAVELLEDLKGEEELAGFVEYNLGIALLKAGEQAEGISELTALGKRRSSDSAKQALYDKTNLMLGSRLMEAGELELARPYFDRVQLDGPFSNRALLGAGWVEARAGRYDRALVPWKILQKRKKTNASVHEALLAVPFAYGKLDVHSTAAVNYGHALDIFGSQVDTLTQSIESIREGKFLEALRRKEADQVKNWVVTLRSIPGAPETHYLLDLMASNDYQEFLRNYQDLNDLFERNEEWLASLAAYENIIALRRGYYEPLLPGLDSKFRALDARIKLRVEQRDTFAQRIDQMLVSRRPEFLAKTSERESLRQLERIRSTMAARPSLVSEETEDRVARLEGILEWRLASEYDARLTEAYKHLQELNTEIEELQEVYNSYVRTRQAATHSYVGYDETIRSLRNRIERVQPRIEQLMARQGTMLEQMAINVLERRRAQLEEYQIKARFALADSYDRANELQEQRADQRKIEQYQAEQADQPRQEDSPEQPADGEPLPQDTPPELEPGSADEEASQ
ncbi:tetratricopeptide repeat protein [Microbulbifer zhoushanensis]|uniref:tetratricopeptide repeat protein n=1 Tax=Microbulbifer zhoushanensis TaxID=2904254 RepID=UPI001F3AB3DA|nr:tetratricopeptide repeat protein [Microbulbifer zhoushanensis]